MMTSYGRISVILPLEDEMVQKWILKKDLV
jgi:hypothetical protein